MPRSEKCGGGTGRGSCRCSPNPEEIRRAIYTTNVVESLHMTLRKVIKTRGSFPSEEAALKLLYLALQNVSKKWKAATSWRTALNHFTLLYGDRMEAAWNRPAR